MVKRLKDRKVIYFVVEGDSKASEGMNELKNLFDEENTKTKNNDNQQVGSANDGKEKLDEGKNKEALDLFLDGCVASDKKASRYVGYMYGNGILFSQNDIQASIFYHIGTIRDDITSYYYLRLMYLKRRGVNQNTERAKEYFEKAVNSGNENVTGVKEAKEELEKMK